MKNYWEDPKWRRKQMRMNRAELIKCLCNMCKGLPKRALAELLEESTQKYWNYRAYRRLIRKKASQP